MLVLCVLLVGLIPLRVAFAAGMEVDLPYEQTWSNNSGRSVNNTFKYELTAADSSSPAPAESTDGVYAFELTGNAKGQKTLHFAFAKPGYYYYNIKPLTTGLAKEYTYDPLEYELMIMVVNGSEGLEVAAMTLQDKDLAKYSALEYDASYTAPPVPPEEEPDDPGGGGNQGERNPAARAADQVIEPTAITEPVPPTAIPDPETPQGILDEPDDWALLNLILMILTVLLAIIDGVLYYRDPRDKYGDEYEYEDEELKRHGLPRILAIVAAICSVILFFLTEDMTEPMIWVDEYTIWMMLLFVATAILTMMSKKDIDEEGEQPATG